LGQLNSEKENWRSDEIAIAHDADSAEPDGAALRGQNCEICATRADLDSLSTHFHVEGSTADLI
jgi:hypothetical protein